MKGQIDYKQVIQVPEPGLQIPGWKKENIFENHFLGERIRKVLIPEPCLKKRVKALARQIARDYKKHRQLYLIPVLKGAFVFAADLGREIIRCQGPEIKIDFYEARTYGSEIKAEGERARSIRILRRPRFIENIDALLIDDVADTVQTLTAILSDFNETVGFDSHRIKVCFLLNKILKNPPIEIEKMKNDLKPAYVGFDVPDVWVAGYGIDADEDFRLLSSIVSVKEEYYL